MMKRLFILLFILCSLAGYSQPVTTYLGTPTTSVLTRGAHRFGTFAYLPGVVAATPDSAGAIRYYGPTQRAQLWTGLGWIDIGTSIDSFTYATRRYVDSSVSALSGDFINNSTAQQTANFNITGNGVMGGNLDVTGSGNFAQNRVQLSHATLGGATKWYNTSGDLYSEVNPDQGGYMSSRRFVFNSAVGDPTAGTDYKGYLYMKSGVPYWSYNGTHTAIPLGGGGASSTTDLTDVSDAAPANNTVLTYNQDSAKYVPTAVARYNFSGVQNGDLLKVQISGGDTTVVPLTPNYATSSALQDTAAALRSSIGTGGGTGDTIYYAASVPSVKKKNGWFNTSNHHYYVLNDEGTYYIGYAPADSIPIGTSGGGGGGGASGGNLLSGFTATTFPTHTNLVDTDGVITTTGTNGNYGNTGLSGLSLASGQSGRVVMKRGASDAENAILGFKKTNTQGGYNNMYASVAIAVAANMVQPFYSPTETTAAGAATFGTVNVGNWLGIYRDGTTGEIWAQTSTDGTTWTNVYEFTDTALSAYTGALYIGIDLYGSGGAYAVGKAYYPQFKAD